nr:uncharacterized protein LOC112024088 [Quercus suber]
MRKFWWGQQGQESKIAWVSWRKLCFSKLKGGMGFRNLQAFNLAMLAKQGWRLFENPNSLVARIYRAKYYPHGDVFNAGLGSSPSFTWRSIRQGLEVVKRGTRWKVGNGRLIHIWEDKWLPTPTTYKVVSPPPQNFDNFPMVSTLIDYDSRRWKVDLVKSLFLPFEASLILNIPISYNLPEDKIIWGLLDISDVALDVLRNGTNYDLETFFGVAWAVWYNRNQVAFEAKCQMPDQIWGFARNYLQDYKGTLAILNINPAKKNNRWTPPPPGVFKINVDGATSVDSRNSSVGAIIRDSCGVVIAACGKYLQGQFSVSEVEALAVESGILLAQSMKLSQISVESNALFVVSSINGKFIDGSIGHLFQGILTLLNSFTSWKVNHVNRDCNRSAHELAQLARRNEVLQVWIGVLPMVVQEIVQSECIR